MPHPTTDQPDAPGLAAVIPIGTSTALPAPLVSPDVDCTDLDGFMLNVERLMASELVAISSLEVVGAALMLWCRAWKQIPAGSIPDDDRVIAAFARMPLPRFRKMRAEILRGFVLCSDGRLYHRALCAEARNAYERKVAFRRKRETDAERLRTWRNNASAKPVETPHPAPPSTNETPDETLRETRFETGGETQSETRFVAEGQGQGQGQGRLRLFEASASVRPEQPPAAPDGATPAGPTDPDPTPGDPPGDPPAPPPPPGKRTTRTARGTRLPKPWALPEDWRDWACRVHRIDPQRAVRISLTFRDYWWAAPGARGVKVDWEATWRVWVRKELGDA